LSLINAIYFREVDRRRTTVPIHAKVSLKRKTIKAICRDIEITINELRDLLQEVHISPTIL